MDEYIRFNGSRVKNIQGQHFGHLIPQKIVGIKNRYAVWECLCDLCGGTREVSAKRLNSNWIKENAENKWLGCHCLLKDDKYTEMICYLSSNILTILRNNTFAMISTFNSQGNLGDNYILEI